MRKRGLLIVNYALKTAASPFILIKKLARIVIFYMIVFSIFSCVVPANSVIINKYGDYSKGYKEGISDGVQDKERHILNKAGLSNGTPEFTEGYFRGYNIGVGRNRDLSE